MYYKKCQEIYNLSFMKSEKKSDYNVGDYVYIITKKGDSRDNQPNTQYKKKILDINFVNIQLKLGIPFKVLFPDYNVNAFYKIIQIHKIDYDTEKYKPPRKS